MTLEELKQSVATQEAPSEGLSLPAQALWWDAKGDWDKAHALCQKAGSREGDWVHAYLHRKEGDLSNASHWYRRSGRPVFEGSLEDEWASVARELLS